MNYFIVLFPFIASLIIGKSFLAFLTRLKFGQSIREDGPNSHLKKQGTPTMGGLLFIITFTICATLFYVISKDIRVIYSLIGLLSFGLIGFLDDYIKVVLKRNLGLRAYQKLLLQLIISILIAILIKDLSINQSLPLTKNSFDLGIFYIPFVVVFFASATNGANLTDGLDGLLTGVSIALSPFFFYVLDPELDLMMATFISALSGFLIFNYNPAKVFMGDVGSLAIGGFLGTVALISGSSLWMLLVMFIYVMETISVIVQVISFKTRKKRVFKMAPIHHHFELSGWKEKNVVFGFWFISFVVSTVSIILFKVTLW